jgi:DNA-directed RNA polymerase specialized sigma24 family protein
VSKSFYEVIAALIPPWHIGPAPNCSILHHNGVKEVAGSMAVVPKEGRRILLVSYDTNGLTSDGRFRTLFTRKIRENREMSSNSDQPNSHHPRGGLGHLVCKITWGTYIMPGRSRDNRNRLPDFYLSPSVKGLRIDPQVRSAVEELWPWFWNFVGCQLGDSDRAGDLAERVAYGVSAYLQKHGQVESLVGLCRVAATNCVLSARARERRIEFRGLSQEIEGSLSVSAPDWQEEVDLGIWIDQILQGHDHEIRVMLQLRLLDRTWAQIGRALGMSGGQARLRFRRALRYIRGGGTGPGPDRGGT